MRQMDIFTRGGIIMCREMGAEEQKHLLKANSYFIPVEILSDGDILMMDILGFGPYIMCKDGRVHSVDYHYKHHHGLELKTQWEREDERED